MPIFIFYKGRHFLQRFLFNYLHWQRSYFIRVPGGAIIYEYMHQDSCHECPMASVFTLPSDKFAHLQPQNYRLMRSKTAKSEHFLCEIWIDLVKWLFQQNRTIKWYKRNKNRILITRLLAIFYSSGQANYCSDFGKIL